MAKKATASDAHLILKLYDLRREAEMRFDSLLADREGSELKGS